MPCGGEGQDHDPVAAKGDDKRGPALRPRRADKASSGAQYHLTDLGSPTLLVMVVEGADPPDVDPSSAGDPVPSPPGPIIDAAFEAPGLGKGGAGQFRPWFWRQALGFGVPGGPVTTVTCRGT